MQVAELSLKELGRNHMAGYKLRQESEPFPSSWHVTLPLHGALSLAHLSPQPRLALVVQGVTLRMVASLSPLRISMHTFT